MSERRIAWAITGAGHMLEECVEMLVKHACVDVFLSRAADEVLHMYHLHTRIGVPNTRVYREDKASAPVVGRFCGGVYSVLVVAPATSNSVAKFACGISDTLVTNLFAQAGKAKVPVIVYPTDLAPEMDSIGPHRESITVFPRPVDLENTTKLKAFAGVQVVGNLEELARCLAACL
jgi:dihydromethanopterin reductase (acceptor)